MYFYKGEEVSVCGMDGFSDIQYGVIVDTHMDVYGQTIIVEFLESETNITFKRWVHTYNPNNRITRL